MSTLPSFSFLSPHLKFEHKKGPPQLVGILLVVGMTLVMHSNLKLPSTPRRREKSVGFGVHQ
jgi:hypothetical protein